MQLLLLNSQKHTLQAIHLLILKAATAIIFFFILGSVHVSHQNLAVLGYCLYSDLKGFFQFKQFYDSMKAADSVRKSADVAGQSHGLAPQSCLLETREQWSIGPFSMDSFHLCHMHYGINPVNAL